MYTEILKCRNCGWRTEREIPAYQVETLDGAGLKGYAFHITGSESEITNCTNCNTLAVHEYVAFKQVEDEKGTV